MLTKLKQNRILLIALVAASVLVIAVVTAVLVNHSTPFGYAREVSPEEAAMRNRMVQTAEGWLGRSEADGSHREIIDLYNCHTPLAQGYIVQYDDSWCATFVSTVAIQCGFTHIIPTECGCERQIGLFMELGCWIEDDSYVPLPGDIIYYSRSDKGFGDCTGWSDHVGIVVGTKGSYIKVIEGNSGDRVQYQIIRINAKTIRGYAVPNYLP